jgi:hypothetical protein
VLLFELAVCGRDPASRVAVVDDVVVDKGCGVKKFEPCCKINDPMQFGVVVRVN